MGDRDPGRIVAVVGLNHRTVPVPVRESVAFAKETLREDLGRLRAEADLAEVAVPSTCNRVEVQAAGDPGPCDRLRHPPEQERVLDAATAAIVDKLLHAPSVYLRQAAREGRVDRQAELLRLVLGIGPTLHSQ